MAFSTGAITIDCLNGNVYCGGNGADGDVILRDGNARNRIRLNADDGNAWLGGNGVNGDVILFPSGGDNKTTSKATIRLDAGNANIYAGGNKKDGDISLREGKGKRRIHLDADGGNAWLGGNGKDGDVILFPSGGDNKTASQATIHLDGSKGRMSSGGSETSGNVELKASNGNIRLRLDGETGNALLGGNGGDGGHMYVFPASGNNTNLSKATIHVDGQAGYIELSGMNCTEEFYALETENIEPGMVVVVSDENTLKISQKEYDKTVAGVVSGVDKGGPGIILDKIYAKYKRIPLTLAGKVYCLVDTKYSPIEVGDMLTTSPTLGHAMKVDDPGKAFGAVIGKALSPLAEGKGQIPILATLS